MPLNALEVVGPRTTLKTTVADHFNGLFVAMHAGVHPVGIESRSFPPTSLNGAELEQFARRSWLRNRSEWTTARWWLDLTVFANSDSDAPIGMQILSSENFLKTREVRTASWLTRAVHGQGFGSEMRRLALSLAFGMLDAQSAVSEAFPENVASERVSIACGYSPAGVQEIDTPEDRVRLHRYRLDRSSWENTEPIRSTVHGFDTWRHLFGI